MLSGMQEKNCSLLHPEVSSPEWHGWHMHRTNNVSCHDHNLLAEHDDEGRNMQDDKSRWSLGPLYSVQSMRLISHFLIREYEVEINPDEAVVFHDSDISEARKRYRELNYN